MEKQLTRHQRLLEVYKLMHERKNANVIYNEFTTRGISVSRVDVERDVELIKEIKKLVKKGYTNTDILKELRRKGYSFGDKPAREIINLRKKQVKKEEEKKLNIVVVNEFLTRPFYEDEFIEQEVVNEDEKKIEDIRNRIKEYEFWVETRYDEIIVDVEVISVGSKRKAEKHEKRLTTGKFKCIFDTIFEKTEEGKFRFPRLKYDEIVDIVNTMWRMFRRSDVLYREKIFAWISEIREIITEKEVKERK